MSRRRRARLTRGPSRTPLRECRREFDLNIERALENWTLANAIRELFANDLDEATG